MGHDPSRAVDDESFGNTAHVVGLTDLVLRIEQNVKLETVAVHVRIHCAAPAAVLADRQHDKVGILAELFVERFDRRHLLAAGGAPSCPYVKEYHFATQRGERNRSAVEVGQFEIDRELARCDRPAGERIEGNLAAIGRRSGRP